MTLRLRPVRGLRTCEPIEQADQAGAELTFGRSSKCDLVIAMPETVERYFSRLHGRFRFDGKEWRVLRDGQSMLKMWFDFGSQVVTRHGRYANLRLPVNEGTIVFRPQNTDRDMVLRWEKLDEPVDTPPAEITHDKFTEPPAAVLGQRVETLAPRFVVFLLVLCHRQLLGLDYVPPTIDDLALWISSKRGVPIRTGTVRKDYLGNLREILQNTKDTRTCAHLERSGAERQHADAAMMAADVMDIWDVNCDLLIHHLQLGVIPNFPDLGWSKGIRG